jgi:ParB family transcriptional regulator, chromosome partitioning protein
MTDRMFDIQSIPIDQITVVNPRVRNKKVFNELVASIGSLGLKKPITVRKHADGNGFDLVCGQGRIEAFMALGQTEIPAVIVDVSPEEGFVMSLIENLARRQHSPLELVQEIAMLRDRGYSTTEIALKTDLSQEYVYAICYLFDHGEERVLAGVEKGIIPPTIALEIARAKDGEVQKALTEAYEQNSLRGNQIMAIRQILERRSLAGKGLQRPPAARSEPNRKLTATSLVRAYQKETERQKLLVKKATLAQSRLLFVVNALRRLLADDHFVTLLRAEEMDSMPKPLAERLGMEVYA